MMFHTEVNIKTMQSRIRTYKLSGMLMDWQSGWECAEIKEPVRWKTTLYSIGCDLAASVLT